MTDRHAEGIEKAAEALDENFNPDRYPVLAAMFTDYARAAVTTYLDHAHPVVDRVEGLPNGTAFTDSMGDVGVVTAGYVHYPETDALKKGYVSKKYGPFRVIHWGGVA